jgi:gas vesicle protein
MNDRMPYVTSIVCFLAGGVAGATAALLLAPQPGRAIRQTMARKMGDTADSAREVKDRVLQKGDEIWGEAAHRVSDAASALSGGDGHKVGAKPDKTASV